MLHFRMNMPFVLMAFYGSIMILAVLLLRGLLKNKLPKFVFPVLWGAVLLRLLVPFSLSSPLSLPVPAWLSGLSMAEKSKVNGTRIIPGTVRGDRDRRGRGAAAVRCGRTGRPKHHRTGSLWNSRKAGRGS